MLSSLPAELIVECLHHLSLEEAVTLAWTNRRMMKIVKRNFQLALMPGPEIRQITISQSGFEEEYLLLTIDWANSQRRTTTMPFLMRPEGMKQRYADDDENHYRAFLRFNKFCDEGTSQCTFQKYIVEVEKLADDEYNVPPVLTSMLIFKAKIDRLFLTISDPVLLKSCLSVLDSCRATIKHKDIYLFRLEMTEEVKEIVANSNFFKRNIRSFHIPYHNPLIKDLIEMPHFVDTRWEMVFLRPSDYEQLIESGVRRIITNQGNISLIEFLTKLFEAAPFKRDWHFQYIYDKGDKWDLTSIEQLLERCNMRYRVVHETHEADHPTVDSDTEDWGVPEFIKIKHYELGSETTGVWHLKISLPKTSSHPFDLQIC